MALLPLLSFSGGELDPALHDNVTLEKFKKGLATARNVLISKRGTIQSRFSRLHLAASKNSGEAIKLYTPPNTNYLLEWGPSYVRLYTFTVYTSVEGLSTSYWYSLSFQVDRSTSFTEDDLQYLHFTTSKGYVYVFRAGVEMLKYQLNGSSSNFISSANKFKIPTAPTSVAVSSAGTAGGYPVEYMATVVCNGEESLSRVSGSPFYWPKPVAAGDSNTLTITWPTANYTNAAVNEVRVYSRPYLGGSWGYLGSTTEIGTSGSNQVAVFRDNGGLPDYGNSTQDIITKFGLDGKAIVDMYPKTGLVYQQRLLLTDSTDLEAIVASRPGFPNNFYRDYPYATDSALQFKAGTSGLAYVLRMVESDGLIVFTTNGVYINAGLLTVNNLALEKKGSWIIKESIPPLVIPGGVFFVDTSNTIRQMVFNQDILTYESLEQTIFSNHLFQEKTIETWAYQDGVTPLIIVTFSDGTWATFTYNAEHQMRAWTRHDSVYPLEQVESSFTKDVTFFVVNKDGDRFIEASLPRVVPVDVQAFNDEVEMLAPNAFMDSIKSRYYALLNNTISPVTPDEWDGELTLGQGDELPTFAVGDIFRWFHPEDHNFIDFEVTEVVDPGYVYKVMPSEEFPSEYGSPENIKLYVVEGGPFSTPLEVTGLDHLEGEEVSVMVDGAIVASPLNDVEDYTTYTVSGGKITLQEEHLGAIVHVGRPIVADVKTLNVTTVEQSPVMLESVNVNKMYIKVHKSRGLYVANTFPEERVDEVDGSSVEKMDSLDEALVPQEADLIGNRYFPPVTKRCEVTVRGDWDNQGQVSLRQVDPFHFEILSIIPDLTVLSRSDR